MPKNANRPDADNPEWTRKEIREARPLLDVLPDVTAAAARASGRRGAQSITKKLKSGDGRQRIRMAASIDSEIRSALLDTDGPMSCGKRRAAERGVTWSTESARRLMARLSGSRAAAVLRRRRCGYQNRWARGWRMLRTDHAYQYPSHACGDSRATGFRPHRAGTGTIK